MKKTLSFLLLSAVLLLSPQMKAQVSADALSAAKMPQQENSFINILSRMPEYPGGEEALHLYIRANLHKSIIYYYTKNRPSDIRRPTIVSFIVRADGSLSNIKIKQCPSNGWGERYDKKIMTLIKNMPRWNPGLNQNGRPRSCSYTLKIDETVLFDFPGQTMYDDLRDEWSANP